MKIEEIEVVVTDEQKNRAVQLLCKLTAAAAKVPDEKALPADAEQDPDLYDFYQTMQEVYAFSDEVKSQKVETAEEGAAHE